MTNSPKRAPIGESPVRVSRYAGVTVRIVMAVLAMLMGLGGAVLYVAGQRGVAWQSADDVWGDISRATGLARQQEPPRETAGDAWVRIFVEAVIQRNAERLAESARQYDSDPVLEAAPPQ